MSQANRSDVLVIDDDDDLREMIATAGALFGVNVLKACNGAEGVSLIRRNQASLKLVLLDYMMPGMRPTACGQAIREALEDEVAVILVTAAFDARERAQELGLKRWLAKPFEFSVLKQLLLAPHEELMKQVGSVCAPETVC